MSRLDLTRAERLDQYVAKQLPTLSRAFAAKLIVDGKVEVNGELVNKAGHKLRSDDHVEIDFNIDEQPLLPTIDIPVIYEDEDCIVIDKPIGVLSHSKGAYNPEATVSSWLAARVSALTDERAGIVHRLDRATSGVMICAKHQSALIWLQKQFSTRKVKKTYLAVVQGSPINEQAVIDMPIERNPRKPQTFRVGSGGKSAVTEYRTVEAGNGFTLLELQPQTGRTHQLRVHLAQLGHPIVGDTFYGGMAADRLFLHARSLEITLSNRERQTFDAPFPPEFRKLLES
jgi:23S rRNA pseudouridine1911/1915/1917 synthase